MAEQSLAKAWEDLSAFLKAQEPLAPYTCLRLGGPAELWAQPRTLEELAEVLRRARALRLPWRVLGAGSSVLVRDEGVRGVVLRLSAPAFTQVQVEGRRLRAGAGASLSAVISQAARHALAGLETVIGTPGTVGGAIRQHVGDHSGELSQYLRRVELLDAAGNLQIHEGEELSLSVHGPGWEEGVVVSAELELEPDDPGAIVKRLRRAWIQRRQSRPPRFQAAVRAFRDPRGLRAANLITEAGLAGLRVGKAEISDRNPSFVLAHPGATARDVLRLLDLVCSQVRERFGVKLELALSVW
jgi:UDP-N-acetylmuramate dehydrogenase